MLRQKYMSLKLLAEIFSCYHSNETIPADQLHWFICLVGFILKRFYLLIYLFIYFCNLFIYCHYYAWDSLRTADERSDDRKCVCCSQATLEREKGDSWKILESLHSSEFPDRSFTVSFQNDYMCGVCAPRKGMVFTPSLFLADLGLFRLFAARSVPGLFHSLALRELTCSWGEFDKTIVCFHMTSWRPYLCPKTMKRRPCLCPKPVLCIDSGHLSENTLLQV